MHFVNIGRDARCRAVTNIRFVQILFVKILSGYQIYHLDVHLVVNYKSLQEMVLVTVHN